MIFDQQEQHQMFKEFKNKQNIHCLFWNDDWVEKDKNLIAGEITDVRAAIDEVGRSKVKQINF